MVLTEENKQCIDSLDYRTLLRQWRFAEAGMPWFNGETGTYWQARMHELRSLAGGEAIHTSASKCIEG